MRVIYIYLRQGLMFLMLSSDDLAKDDLEFLILPSAKITYIKVSLFGECFVPSLLRLFMSK